MAINIIVTNNTGSSITLDDLGVIISSAEIRNLSNTFDPYELTESVDLNTHIASGDLGVNDGIDDLSVVDGLAHVNIESEYQDLEQDGDIGGVVPTTSSVLKVVNPNAVTLSDTYTNFNWTNLHTNSNTDVFEWSLTNPDRLIVKEAGLYNIQFSFYLRISNGSSFASTFCRVMKNDADIISNETYLHTYVNEIQQLFNSGYTELQVGDYLTLQAHGDAGTDNEVLISYINLIKMEGVKGDDGAPGGTTVTIQNNDTPIVTNCDAINFEGDSVSVVDEGSNKATIIVNDSSHVFKYINITNDTGNIDLNVTPPEPYPWNVQTIRDVDTYDHSILTNNTRLDILRSGWYKVSYMMNFDNTANTRVNIRCAIRKNGVDYIESTISASYIRNNSDDYMCNSLPAVLVHLNSGEYVELMHNQEGSNSSTLTYANQCWLQMEFCRED